MISRQPDKVDCRFKDKIEQPTRLSPSVALSAALPRRDDD